MALSSISTGATLRGGQGLTSPSGKYFLAMQTDGNLVEYTSAGVPIWCTRTQGYPGAYLALQGDGNLVLYSTTGLPLWASYTFGSAVERLSMQDDGNIVLYSFNPTAALWATMTLSPINVGGRLSADPGYPYGQCTWWAYERAQQYIGGHPAIHGDAHLWASSATQNGFSVGSGPRVFSIAVFQPNVDGAGGAGHVAWVVDVYPNSQSIVVTEMDFPTPGRETSRNVGGAFGKPGIDFIYLLP